MSFLDRTGAVSIATLSKISELGAFFVLILKSAWCERRVAPAMVLDIIMRQILFTGVEALKIITAIALIIGGVVILETFSILPGLGGESAIGTILVIVVVRELGPLLTAFIVIGRSGTAISTEIGYMTVNHEVEAIESMGINPLRFIALPRIIGVAVAIAALSFYFNTIALFGGYFFARFMVDIPFGTYIANLSAAIGFWDVAVSGVKCAVFGVIVATICCYAGFTVRYSFTEIPQVTTKAVVTSIYLCFLSNILITLFFYI